MSIIEEIRERNATVIDAANELGRGLMRGNRARHQLGYSWENATLTAIDAYELPDMDQIEVRAHLLAFAAGMKDDFDEDEFQDMRKRIAGASSRLESAFNDGFRRGQDEDYVQTYPAGQLLTAEEELELRRQAETVMEVCGCGATKPGECAAAVEGYYTSLGQRGDDALISLAEVDGCEAARVLLIKREHEREGS